MQVKEVGLGLVLVRNFIGLVLLVPFGFILLAFGESIDPKPLGYDYAASIMVVVWCLAFVFGFAVPVVVYVSRKLRGE